MRLGGIGSQAYQKPSIDDSPKRFGILFLSDMDDDTANAYDFHLVCKPIDKYSGFQLGPSWIISLIQEPLAKFRKTGSDLMVRPLRRNYKVTASPKFAGCSSKTGLNRVITSHFAVF